MSPATKKSVSWTVGLGTGVIALVTFAFTVGVNVSASTHRYDTLDTRVTNVEDAFSAHCKDSACDARQMKSKIDTLTQAVTRQNTLIENLTKTMDRYIDSNERASR